MLTTHSSHLSLLPLSRLSQQCCGFAPIPTHCDAYIPRTPRISPYKYHSTIQSARVMTDPVQTPIQTVSVSCFSFGEIRDSYEQPLFRDSDKLKPSSSTETESGFQDMQVPLHQPLTPGQRASARECVTADKRWIETYVPSTYLANVRAPRRLDHLCRMVKTGTIGKPTSILVPQPKLPNEESERLQNLFPSFWLGVLLVILAWVFRHSIYVWKLRRDWPYGERVHAELGRYIRYVIQLQIFSPQDRAESFSVVFCDF